jgi:hypothetical protein
MRTFIFLFAFAALPVNAQVTFFNDSLGLPIGTANQMGNTTFYNDAKGLPLGTANTPQPILPFSAPQPISPPGPFFPSSPRGM